MDKTSKTSIAAIIFVIIYFLFIVFISLFKGLNLYNLKIKNVFIHKIFIKIDKKIIITLNDIKISPSKNYKKEALKIHNFFYLFNKILPLFEKIEVKNVYKNNKLLLKKLYINKNNFYLQTSNIVSNGKFKIYKQYSSIYFNRIKFKDFELNNTTLFSYYTKNYVFINIKSFYKGFPIYLALKANDNLIYFSLNSKKIHITYKSNNFFIKNLYLLGKINTLFTYYKINFKVKNFKFNYNQIKALAKNIKGEVKNRIINATSDYAQIEYKKILKKINIYNLSLIYDLKEKFIISFAKKIKLFYKNYILNSQNTTLNYNFTDNSLFLHALNLQISNDINTSIKEITILKTKKLYFYTIDNKVSSKYFILKNKYIKGNKSIIILDDIIGKVFDFNTTIKKPKIDLINKKIYSKKINFNNIVFDNNSLNFKNKTFILKTHTNTLFNKNVNEVLKRFNINIPLLQIDGNNSLNLKVLFNKKIKNIYYDLNSSNSHLKIKDFTLKYNYLNIKGDINNTFSITKDVNYNSNFLKASIDSNTSIFINKKFLNSYVFIKYFDIKNILNIKNFNEKVVFDLKKGYLFLLNSYIFANLKTKTIYFYYLKNLLKYSIFNEIFENGKIILKLHNIIEINANAKLNYPLFLNQKDARNINATILIDKENIFIKNKHINTQIINFEKIYSHLNNLDINIESLIKIINTIKKIINTSTSNTKTHTLAKIISTNTNFIYKNHKFLTQKANLIFDKEINFSASYKKSSLRGYTKNNFLLIEGTNYNKEILTPLLSFFNNFNLINLDFVVVKSPEDFYTGKIYIKRGIIKELGVLNNIIAFINTIPSLLSLNTPGFSAKGYKITNGYINYLFYKNILYFKKITIKGKNLDFNGKGYVDLNKNLIKMKIEAIIKIKIKKIPIIGKAISYLLFGKDGYLHVKIIVNGDLNNPKISKDLGGGIIESPLKLFKRVLTLPFNIF